MYKLSETSWFAPMATSSSPWPPWSSTISWRASCSHVWPTRPLLALRNHVQIVGDLLVCSFGDLVFSLATLIIYNQLESILLARMANSASPCPPWSCTNCRRAPGLLVWRTWASPWPHWSSSVSRTASCLPVWGKPRLLLRLRDHLRVVGELPVCSCGETGLLHGHPDHLQSLGEHLACMLGDYGISSASVIIYELSESSRFALVANLGFSLPSVIMYKLSESSRFARVANLGFSLATLIFWHR